MGRHRAANDPEREELDRLVRRIARTQDLSWGTGRGPEGVNETVAHVVGVSPDTLRRARGGRWYVVIWQALRAWRPPGEAG